MPAKATWSPASTGSSTARLPREGLGRGAGHEHARPEPGARIQAPLVDQQPVGIRVDRERKPAPDRRPDPATQRRAALPATRRRGGSPGDRLARRTPIRRRAAGRRRRSRPRARAWTTASNVRAARGSPGRLRRGSRAPACRLRQPPPRRRSPTSCAHGASDQRDRNRLRRRPPSAARSATSPPEQPPRCSGS